MPSYLNIIWLFKYSSQTFNKNFNLERCPIILDDACLLIRGLADEIVSPTDDDSLQKCVSIVCCLVIKSEMSYQKKMKFAKYFLDVVSGFGRYELDRSALNADTYDAL